jgi:hypothetical protein
MARTASPWTRLTGRGPRQRSGDPAVIAGQSVPAKVAKATATAAMVPVWMMRTRVQTPRSHAGVGRRRDVGRDDEDAGADHRAGDEGRRVEEAEAGFETLRLARPAHAGARLPDG